MVRTPLNRLYGFMGLGSKMWDWTGLDGWIPLRLFMTTRASTVLINEPILHRSIWSQMHISEIKLLRTEPLYLMQGALTNMIIID